MTGQVKYLKWITTPGALPVVDKWDGGKVECSHGLRWSPTPSATRDMLRAEPDAKKYIVAPHKLADLICHFEGRFPQKVMSRSVAGPVFEVDYEGHPI